MPWNLCLPALLLVSCLGLAAADPTVLISSAFVAKEAPRASAKLPGFMTLVNDEVEWEIEVSQIVSIHRFNDGSGMTNLVIAVPLVMGRVNTFVMIPSGVMTYEQVLALVGILRSKEH